MRNKAKLFCVEIEFMLRQLKLTDYNINTNQCFYITMKHICTSYISPVFLNHPKSHFDRKWGLFY